MNDNKLRDYVAGIMRIQRQRDYMFLLKRTDNLNICEKTQDMVTGKITFRPLLSWGIEKSEVENELLSLIAKYAEEKESKLFAEMNDFIERIKND